MCLSLKVIQLLLLIIDTLICIKGIPSIVWVEGASSSRKLVNYIAKSLVQSINCFRKDQEDRNAAFQEFEEGIMTDSIVPLEVILCCGCLL
jgi:hypothetical protein